MKEYAHLGEEMTRAFKQYRDEVKAFVHPAPENCYNVKPEFVEDLNYKLKQIGDLSFPSQKEDVYMKSDLDGGASQAGDP